MDSKSRAVMDAVETEDRAQVLRAIQRRLAEALDADPSPRDLPTLAKQLASITADLAALPNKETNVVDDLASRRSARRSGATG